MKRLLIVCLVAAAGATGAAGASIYGPKGEFRSTFRDLTYDPSRGCIKPIRPYGDDSYSRESYLRGGRMYLDCIKAASSDDMEYVQEVVQEGYVKAADDFLDEVKRGY